MFIGGQWERETCYHITLPLQSTDRQEVRTLERCSAKVAKLATRVLRFSCLFRLVSTVKPHSNVMLLAVPNVFKGKHTAAKVSRHLN